MKKNKNNYEEKLIDWVLTFGYMDSLSDAQFSATEVAHIIMTYQEEKLKNAQFLK